MQPVLSAATAHPGTSTDLHRKPDSSGREVVSVEIFGRNVGYCEPLAIGGEFGLNAPSYCLPSRGRSNRRGQCATMLSLVITFSYQRFRLIGQRQT